MATKHFEEHGHHVTPTSVLFRNLVILLILMVLTVVAARVTHFLPTMPANVVAMSIAIVKAFLVVSIFMGVRYTTNLGKLFAIGGFVWFLLMFGILVDYFSRPWEPVKGWVPAGSTSLPRADDLIE
jgi:caa(3)-type oxidase subunit IV